MGLRTPAGASRGGSFFVGRDVSAGDGVHTYSCVRYTTLPSVCTDYARSVSQADETGFYAPSVAHNALPRRPWRCISVVLSIILQTLGSFAMRSRKSMCVRRPLRLRPLRCGKMCVVTGDVCAPVAGAYVLLRCGEIVVTCAHRWPVLTSYYVVERCEMMCCTTYRYLFFYGKVRFVGVVGDTQSHESE